MPDSFPEVNVSQIITDFQVPKSLYGVVAEVESITGKKIMLRRIPRDPQFSYSAACGIRDDGVPEIVFTSDEYVDEINFCHELLHLTLQVRGYPRTKTLSGAGGFDAYGVGTVLSDVGSLIEHDIIYEQMAKFGFDPWGDLERKVENFMFPLEKYVARCKTEYNSPAAFRVGPSLHLARAFLEVQSRSLKKELTKVCKKKLQKSFRVGRTIANTIRNDQDKTPESCEKVLAKIMALLEFPRECYLVTNTLS